MISHRLYIMYVYCMYSCSFIYIFSPSVLLVVYCVHHVKVGMGWSTTSVVVDVIAFV